jgi:hypothetical protein
MAEKFTFETASVAINELLHKEQNATIKYLYYNRECEYIIQGGFEDEYCFGKRSLAVAYPMGDVRIPYSQIISIT